MPTRVLFVCLGNICRSPLAEGVFRQVVEERGLGEQYEIASAGTGAWHVGKAPDPRSREVAARHGVSLDGQRARKVTVEDLERYDHVLAMDEDNLADLLELGHDGARSRIRLLRDHDPEGGGDVPDPYYDGPQGFDTVYAMVRRSCEALLDALEEERAR